MAPARFRGTCSLLAAAMASLASAYEEDTHFQITYIVCRIAGLSGAEALTVAAVDQGMDDSPGTVANGGTGGIIPNIPEEHLWHALDRDGKMGPKGILARKEELFNIALGQTEPGVKLFYLGVFFHYQQDTWAHRHHYDGKPTTYAEFTTYNTPFGHARHGHQPDRPPFDPVVALLSLEDGIKYARAFLEKQPGRTVNPFFNGYQGALGKLEDDWEDKRKGKYFHMLASEGEPNSPRRFLTDLLRAQIESYRVSSDPNPFFFLRETADRMDLERSRGALQRVCDAYAAVIGEPVNIPTAEEKRGQGFTSLTSKHILDGMPR